MFTMMTIAALAATQSVSTPIELGAVAAPATAGAVATVQPARTVATKYCVRGDLTGSLIPRKVCKTRGQWLDEGFDPLTAKRAR